MLPVAQKDLGEVFLTYGKHFVARSTLRPPGADGPTTGLATKDYSLDSALLRGTTDSLFSLILKRKTCRVSLNRYSTRPDLFMTPVYIFKTRPAPSAWLVAP